MAKEQEPARKPLLSQEASISLALLLGKWLLASRSLAWKWKVEIISVTGGVSLPAVISFWGWGQSQKVQGRKHWATNWLESQVLSVQHGHLQGLTYQSIRHHSLHINRPASQFL